MQPSLFDRLCPCGRDTAAKAGLCRRCYFARWHSRARFNGLREKVLDRDGHRCRVCETAQPIVHHRRRDAGTEEDLITIASRVTIRFDTTVASVSFAGLVAPGLYQFNLTIPDLADGDHAVTAEIGGTRTQKIGRIRIRRQASAAAAAPRSA